MLKIFDLKDAKNSILQRTPINYQFPKFGDEPTPPEAVDQILQSIRLEGDAVLRRWTTLFDGVTLEDFRIPQEQISNSTGSLTPELVAALETAAQRIRQFHELQPLPNWETSVLGGLRSADHPN